MRDVLIGMVFGDWLVQWALLALEQPTGDLSSQIIFCLIFCFLVVALAVSFRSMIQLQYDAMEWDAQIAMTPSTLGRDIRTESELEFRAEQSFHQQKSQQHRSQPRRLRRDVLYVVIFIFLNLAVICLLGWNAHALVGFQKAGPTLLGAGLSLVASVYWGRWVPVVVFERARERYDGPVTRDSSGR